MREIEGVDEPRDHQDDRRARQREEGHPLRRPPAPEPGRHALRVYDEATRWGKKPVRDAAVFSPTMHLSPTSRRRCPGRYPIPRIDE